jgi:hypothetical protein
MVFDVLYLTAAAVIGFVLLFGGQDSLTRTLAGIMTLVLVGGDAFHLVPRIYAILTGKEEQMRRVLGRGKQMTSITMTIFYILLWHIGLLVYTPKHTLIWSCIVYALALMRILLCLLPQNEWSARFTPVKWSVWRNVPFFLQGMIVSGLFLLYGNASTGLGLVWIAIILSFVFYLPVVLWVNKSPKIGMLMLPKTCAYLWLLAMCLPL